MVNRTLLLDTHVWYHFLVSPDNLRKPADDAIVLAGKNGSIVVAPVSVWELAMLERDGRVDLEGGALAWCKCATSFPGITLVNFTPEIAVTAVQLPKPMHKDPSDRILVATALVEGHTIVTADKAVLKFAQTIGLDHIRA